MGQKTWAEHQSILEGCTFGCIYLTRFCIQLIYNGLYGDMNPSLPKRPNRLKPVSERTGFIVKHLLNLVHVLPATDCWEFTGPKDAYVYLNRVFRPLLYRQRVHLLRILSGIASDMEVLQRIAAERANQGCTTSKPMSVVGFGLCGLSSLRGQKAVSPGSRVLMMYLPGGSS